MKPNKIKLITSNHKKTSRNYLARMKNNKPEIMKISKKYNFHYWDGNRKFGYGGYKYDGRWKLIAKKIIKKYKLNKNSRILDVGCGKGFLVYELTKLLNSKNIYGIDISRYSINKSPKIIRKNLSVKDCRKGLNYKKKYFDLILSINLIYNFSIYEIKNFLRNIVKISKKSYISTESYRNERELFNLQCWALTAESFFSEKEWNWIFKSYGYNRDFELIYFT